MPEQAPRQKQIEDTITNGLGYSPQSSYVIMNRVLIEVIDDHDFRHNFQATPLSQERLKIKLCYYELKTGPDPARRKAVLACLDEILLLHTKPETRPPGAQILGRYWDSLWEAAKCQ